MGLTILVTQMYKVKVKETTKKPLARSRGAITFLSGCDQLVKKTFFKFFEVFVFLYTLYLHRLLQLSSLTVHGRKSTNMWKKRQGF
jgi:hypothetical protein